jgi:hypothetical protein
MMYMRATPSVAIAVLIYPLFDLLRVVTLRLIRGRSPFSADRNHIHHLFIDAGISHRRSTFYILLITVSAIAIAWILRNQSILLVGLVLLAWILGITLWVKAWGRSKGRKAGGQEGKMKGKRARGQKGKSKVSKSQSPKVS